MTEQKIVKGELVKLILVSIGFAGLMFIGAALPGIFKIIPQSFLKKEYSKKSMDKALSRLLARGLVKFSQGQNGWRIELTERGKNELRIYEFGKILLKPPKKWDGKWRLFVFDIAEKKKHTRDKVRDALKNFNFYRLQDSVWAYPYECEEILELLRTKYGVRYEALYIRAEYIAKDKYLRAHFNLK